MIRIYNQENKKYVEKVIVPEKGKTIENIKKDLMNQIKEKTTINL